MKGYLVWALSPFVSNDWTITKETLLTCEQTSHSLFPLTGSHFLQLVCPPCTHPSALLSAVVYLVQGGLGWLPRRAVLLQSYLLTIIDSEELGEEERGRGGKVHAEGKWSDRRDESRPAWTAAGFPRGSSVRPGPEMLLLLKHPLTHPSAFFITSSLSV